MNEHFPEVLDVADDAVTPVHSGDSPRVATFQNDSDYYVDPLDGYDGPGSSGCEVPSEADVEEV